DTEPGGALAEVLARARRVAERAQRRRARLLRRHPARDLVLDLHREMGLDFAREVLVLSRAQQAAEAGHRARPQTLRGCGASSRPMAAVARCHFDVSRASCVRPAGVSM